MLTSILFQNYDYYFHIVHCFLVVIKIPVTRFEASHLLCNNKVYITVQSHEMEATKGWNIFKRLIRCSVAGYFRIIIGCQMLNVYPNQYNVTSVFICEKTKKKCDKTDSLV